MIRVACPTCSEVREFATHLAGWDVRCFWCESPIPVPASPDAAVSHPAPRRPPVARRVAEAARRTAEPRLKSPEPNPTPPARRRRKRLSGGGYVGVLAFGVTLIGVVAAALLA